MKRVRSMAHAGGWGETVKRTGRWVFRAAVWAAPLWLCAARADAAVVRSVFPREYEPGGTVTVTLRFEGISGASMPVAVRESVPARWTPAWAGGQGVIGASSVEWNVTGPLPPESLQYQLTAPSDAPNAAVFRGTAGGAEIAGDSYCLPLLRFEEGKLQGAWRRWNAETGLTQTYSTQIETGREGRVWVGHGVPGLSMIGPHSVTKIPGPRSAMRAKEDAAGRLWIIREEDGAFAGFEWFDEGSRSWNPVPYPGNGEWTRSVNYMMGWMPLSKKAALVKHAIHLWRMDHETGRAGIVLRGDETEIGNVRAIHNAPGGGYWISGSNGLAKVSVGDASPFVRLSRIHAFPAASGLNSALFGAEIPEGEPGAGLYATAIWDAIGKRAGLRWRDGAWEILFAHPVHHALDIWPSHSGGFYLMLQDNTTPVVRRHLMNMDGNRLSPLLGAPPPDKYYAAVRARDGSIWVAHLHGVGRFSPNLWQTPPALQDGGQVYSIFDGGGGRIWMLRRSDLTVYKDGEVKRYPLPSPALEYDTHTECLFALPGGLLAVNTSNGLFAFDPRRERFEPVNHPAHGKAFFIDSLGEGGAFLATVNRHPDTRKPIVSTLEVFNGEWFHPVAEIAGRFAYEPKMFRCALFWQGRFWFPHYNAGDGYAGLARVDGLSDFTLFGREAGYADTAVFSLLPLGGNRLWAGGRNSIHEFDGARWTAVKDQIDEVWSMVRAGDGSVWAASWSGVHRLLGGHWYHYTEEDGLPTAIVNEVYEDSRGGIWVGHLRGASLFHPEADANPPDTFIPDETNLKTTPASGEAQFTFYGVDEWDYTRPRRLYFTHRIDGGEWSPATADTIVTLGGLEPGPHTFEARAIDRNGNPDPTPAFFEFTAERPWHRTPAVVALAAAASLLILGLLYLAGNRHVQLRALVRTQDRQLREAEEHLIRVSEEEQQRIGRELHDGIAQDLAAVSYMNEMIIDDLSPGNPEEAGQLRNILDVIQSTREKVRDLSRALFPLNLQKYGLQTCLEEFCGQTGQRFKVECRFRADARLDSIPPEKSLHVYRILQEAVYNAAKHSGASVIEVTARTRNGMLVLTAKDDGSGYYPGSVDGRGLGLAIMRRRAAMLGGRLRIDTQQGAGTEVTLSLRNDSRA